MDLGASHQTIREELRRLIAAGVVEQDRSSRPHRVRFADESPIAEPLRQLVDRTIGVEVLLRRSLVEIAGIHAAAVYGSWAARSVTPTSDVDVLLIVEDDFDYEHVRALGDEISRATSRPIDWAVFTLDEARQRVHGGSGFFRGVLAGPLIDVIGDVRVLLGSAAA
jgi:predicted nucleotidyltransferase